MEEIKSFPAVLEGPPPLSTERTWLSRILRFLSGCTGAPGAFVRLGGLRSQVGVERGQG